MVIISQAVWEAIKKNWKRYLVSIVLTFAAGVCAELLMNIDAITLSTLKDGTYLGILFTAARTGLKLVLEGIVFIIGTLLSAKVEIPSDVE